MGNIQVNGPQVSFDLLLGSSDYGGVQSPPG